MAKIRKSQKAAAHPRLWPYLAGLCIVLFLGGLLTTAAFNDQKERIRRRAEYDSLRMRVSADSQRPPVGGATLPTTDREVR